VWSSGSLTSQQDTTHDLIFFHFKGYKSGNLLIEAFQKCIQSLGLRNGTWKSVKNKSFGITTCIHLVFKHSYCYFVGNQLTRCHIFFSLESQGSIIAHFHPKQISRRDVRKSIFFYQLLGLRTLSGSRRTEKY